MINWKQVAELNGLSPEAFKKEIFTVAAALGSMDLDKQEEKGRAMRFTCSDEVGKLELYVRRVEE